MDDLISDMQSKKLISINKQFFTVEQAISYALIKKCNINYLQRDLIDWQDWFKGNLN